MRRIVLLGVIVVAAIAAAWLSWGVHRNDKIEATFKELPVGASESQLTASLGKPWKSAACGKTFGGSIPTGCAKEIIYADAFAPALPGYWAFFFDDSGRLIDRYMYGSP